MCETTGYNCSINASITKLQFAKHPSAARSSISVLLSELFLIELAGKIWFFEQLKPNFHKNYLLRSFNQGPNGRFCTCTSLLDCLKVCLFLRKRNLVRRNCQETHICMNLLDEQTRFFSKQPSQLLLSKTQSTILHVQWFNYNVPGKYHCIASFTEEFSQKLVLVYFFPKHEPDVLKNQSLSFIRHGLSWPSLSLLETYGIVIYSAWFLAMQFFQNDPLRFSYRILHQQLCNCTRFFN